MSIPQLTVLLPFYNEQGFLHKTLRSLALQRGADFDVLLLDNGSTDHSVAEAMAELAAAPQLCARMMSVSVPGKTNALAAGLAELEAPWVAVCDADTYYPPDYMLRVLSLFKSHPNAVAVMAIDVPDMPGTQKANARIRHVLSKARRYPDRCHAGGYAQAYSTRALRAAGGFDAVRWPWVLEDHEIIHRLHALGPSVYDANHVCITSTRRTDRRRVSWTWSERLLYRHLPRRTMDWFFYRYLAAKLSRRGAVSTALRERPWM